MTERLETISKKVRDELERLKQVGDFDYVSTALVDLSLYKLNPNIQKLDDLKAMEKLEQQLLNVIRRKYNSFTPQELDQLESELNKLLS